MELAELIVQKLRALPPERQREILDFTEFLTQATTRPRPRRDPGGLWADLSVAVSAEDIDAARQELWGNFPRKNL